MKEEEARTKWCPFDKSDNRNQHQRSGTRSTCIASDCMMWVADIDVIYSQEKAVYKTLDSGRCGLVR